MHTTNAVLKRLTVAGLVTATIAGGTSLIGGAASAQVGPIDDLLEGSASASPSVTPSVRTSASATASSAVPSGSASPSTTRSPSGTPSASTSASTSASATPTATVSPSPSATPSATEAGGGDQPSTPPGCDRAAEVMLRETTINATGRAGVAVTSTPNSFVELLAYTRPSTQFRVVRSGTTDDQGTITFADLRPPGNTRLRAQQRGCAFGQDKVLNVRTQISLDVVRNGTRDYTFSGRALPARRGGLIVSLYRVEPSGRQVLTSQARADASSGRYVINRRFSGTGRFGFVVRTGQDLQNAPGSSNVRSLLVF